MPKKNPLPHRSLKITVTPAWRAHSYDDFAAPARKAFEARLTQEWTTFRHPRQKGRPSLCLPVEALCKQIWTEWGETFSERTLNALVQEVTRRLNKQDGCIHDAGRIGRHVREWMDTNLSIADFPRSLLRGRTGKPLVEMARGLVCIQMACQEHATELTQAWAQLPNKLLKDMTRGDYAPLAPVSEKIARRTRELYAAKGPQTQ